MSEFTYYLYILATKPRGGMFSGMAVNDLVKKIREEKANPRPGYIGYPDVRMLVYYETYHDLDAALRRGRRLKMLPWAVKVAMVEKDNPQWIDLYDALTSTGAPPPT